MRLYLKNVYPAEVSKCEIQVSQSYDIPNLGTKVCDVGDDYHIDLDGQFQEKFDHRKIQFKENQIFGLIQRCTIVRITTKK